MGLDHLKAIQVIAMAVIIAGMVLTNKAKLKKPAGTPKNPKNIRH